MGTDVLRRSLQPMGAAIAAAGLAALPVSAQANPLLLAGPQLIQSVFTLLSSSSMCVAYVYDANGNRVSQTTAAVPTASPQWGSAQFGCFVWAQ